MSHDLVPYGANGAWRFDDDVAEIAAKYRIKFKTLKHSDGRAGGVVSAARDALAWKLTTQRGFTDERAARFMKISRKGVIEARARHVHRINTFNARFKPVEEPADA